MAALQHLSEPSNRVPAQLLAFVGSCRRITAAHVSAAADELQQQLPTLDLGHTRAASQSADALQNGSADHNAQVAPTSTEWLLDQYSQLCKTRALQPKIILEVDSRNASTTKEVRSLAELTAKHWLWALAS